MELCKCQLLFSQPLRFCREVSMNWALYQLQKMSGGLNALALKKKDVTKRFASVAQVGATKTNFQMEQCIFQKEL